MATTRIDWPRVLEEIAHLLGDAEPGFPERVIPLGAIRLGQALDRPKSTVQGWQLGSMPRHDDGEMLIDRWCQLTGKAREFVPRERRSLSAAMR